jgi:hypothetical protein
MISRPHCIRHSHVRLGQEVVVKEITSSGFKRVGEEKLLQENTLAAGFP